MSEFENAVPKKEQELKDRTDEVIMSVGALPDEELSQVSGGYDDSLVRDSGCTSQSQYACKQIQCDTASVLDCAAQYYEKCLSHIY